MIKMGPDTFRINARKVSKEELNQLLTTDLLVDLEPGKDDYEDRSQIYSAGVVNRRDEPDKSTIGMRMVPGNASGEDRYTTNLPAENISPAELIDRNGGQHPCGIYVPIEMVLAALEVDSIEELQR